MWKDEYSRFQGLTEEIYYEYRYGMSSYGYWIYQEEFDEEIDEEDYGVIEILYLDSDDGGIIFSSENDIFPEKGMQIKMIGSRYADISTKVLREITGIMSKFMSAKRNKWG